MNLPVEVLEAVRDRRCVLVLGPEAAREIFIESLPPRRRRRPPERFDPEVLEPGAIHRVAAQRFDVVLGLSQDRLLERAAGDRPVEVRLPGDELFEPGESEALRLHKLRGCLSQPLSLTRPHGVETQRKAVRKLLRRQVLFFVGFRIDDPVFEALFEALSEAYGGELPRVHMAVAQDGLSDYHWQKWVWRGLLLFLADPSEVAQALEDALDD